MEKQNKKIQYLNIIPILIIAFILFKMVGKLDVYLHKVNVIKIVSPIIWAFAIAYLLNPAMRFLEKRTKLSRGLVILLIYILVIGIISMFILFISPSIVESITDIAIQIPGYFDETSKWLGDLILEFETLGENGLDTLLEDNLKDILKTASSALNDVFSTLLTRAIDITSAFFKLIIALMISFYFLKDKEKFKDGGRDLVYALFGRSMGNNIIAFTRDIDRQFSNYIVGKTIDSLIIAGIVWGGLNLIGAPYTVLLALIIGITNMIPYFGPFIGAVPAVIITLFTSPKQALMVLIFMIVVQQFDGLYLGPKILGKQVGLSPLWIIIAIIVGGGLFGILGMLLAVPIMAVIRTVYLKFVEKKLSEQRN